MKKLLVLILIYFFIVPTPSYAIFGKKDYKKNFLQNASNAEKRNNDKSAFFIYEKTMFYYKDDKEVLEAYAGFCERNKYFDKAQVLYQKLYDLTKDEHYLFKKYSLEIENTKLSTNELKKINKDKRLSTKHKGGLNTALILQFFYKKDWKNTKIYCDKVAKTDLNGKTINACVIACEKLSDKKSAYEYYFRFYEISPKNTDNIKKILVLAEEFGDTTNQEKFLKKFSELNPKDNGIKYRLAGFYEKHNQYAKANKIYEELLASGDKSTHLKQSYAFSKKQLNKPTETVALGQNYEAKPLKGDALKEKLLYDALDKKDFKKAELYMDELLKKKPKSAKFLKLRFDIAMAQDNYKDAIIFSDKLNEITPRSIEDEKLLAFLYSKTENYPKAIEIIENLLQKDVNNQKLLNLALEYSMASKKWDKAMIYTNQLLVFTPELEKLLKTKSDIYSIQKDFPNAIKSYENLIALYPKQEYKLILLDLYMANQNFAQAQVLIEPLYQQNPSNEKIIKSYLNILMAQNKTQKAYEIVRIHQLENTKEGALVLADLSMLKKDYNSARCYYLKALNFAPEDNSIKNGLAQSYRMLKKIDCATALYQDILYKNPNNLNARLGLGYLEIDKKEYENSRNIFQNILVNDPENKPAKVGVANSYIANGDNLQTLKTLKQMPQDNEIRLMEAQTYYNMSMPTDAKQILSGVINKDAEDLKYKIRRDEAITIIPTYSLLTQNLAQQFNLSCNQMGIRASQKTKNNLELFTEYNMYVYGSGNIQPIQPNQSGILHNVTNEVRGGVLGRPNQKNEFRADIGTKIFQFDQGYMINTDSWIKHYFSDKFNLKLGAKRNNLEQSYLSAVGMLVGGVFTGQVADNRAYLEYESKLPKQFYSFGRYSYGVMTAQNLQNNPYMEGMVGVGRVVYNNPDNKWINTVNLDLVSYNSGYRYNLLDIYDNLGNLYGGYFSPQYFTANTLGAKIEGKIKKWNLKYGVKGFGGGQYASRPHLATSTWGIAPYLAYDLNDNVTFNVSYSHYNYGDIQRDLFMFNAVIRGFKRRAKN